MILLVILFSCGISNGDRLPRKMQGEQTKFFAQYRYICVIQAHIWKWLLLSFHNFFVIYLVGLFASKYWTSPPSSSIYYYIFAKIYIYCLPCRIVPHSFHHLPCVELWLWHTQLFCQMLSHFQDNKSLFWHPTIQM